MSGFFTQRCIGTTHLSLLFEYQYDGKENAGDTVMKEEDSFRCVSRRSVKTFVSSQIHVIYCKIRQSWGYTMQSVFASVFISVALSLEPVVGGTHYPGTLWPV